MNCALRSSSGGLIAKRLLAGKTLTFVRNAGGGGHPEPIRASAFPFPPGPKQMQQLKNWSSAAAIFGATSFVGLCYFTDWRVITDWIPFYNGKYKSE